MDNREAIEKRLIKVLKAEVAHCFGECLGACVSCNNGTCECDSALKLNMLMELEQYRELGTVKEIRIREAQFKRLSEGYLNDLSRLREYQELGTLEQVREAVERMKPKKPFRPFGTHSYKCPSCWKFIAHEVDDNSDLESSMAEWCPYCGSHIDWSVEE